MNPITEYALTKRDLERLDFLMNLQVMLNCEPLLLGADIPSRKKFLVDVTNKINEYKRRQEYTEKIFLQVLDERNGYSLI